MWLDMMVVIMVPSCRGPGGNEKTTKNGYKKQNDAEGRSPNSEELRKIPIVLLLPSSFSTTTTDDSVPRSCNKKTNQQALIPVKEYVKEYMSLITAITQPAPKTGQKLP